MLDKYEESTLELVAVSLMEIDMSDEEIDAICNKIRSNEIDVDLTKSIREIRRQVLNKI